jgi:hypothetical protein
MKTLIVHPEDRSTYFLDIVYKNVENPTIVTGGVTKDELREMIEDHDQVMMMGHGSPSGLFSIGKFGIRDHSAYAIDSTMVEALSKKQNSIFIWCNADQFVEKYNLKGFYSGMFISEVGEACYCGLLGTVQEVVDESNMEFVELLGSGSLITLPKSSTNSILDSSTTS